MYSALLALTLASQAYGCALHDNYERQSQLPRRQDSVPSTPGREPTDWAYEASFNWGRINPNYTLCQTGTQQAPIPLTLNQGLSQKHAPEFHDYARNVSGNFFNWGYGPSYTLHHEKGDLSTLPSITFDDETAYLAGWHIHSPTDHSINGDRSKAELHLVHKSADDEYRAVLAVRLDPGRSTSGFFSSLPTPMISFDDATTMEDIALNHDRILREINGFEEHWAYKGSLTSPPCTEGIRWFVARNVLYVSVEQMQAILAVSAYSARAEQEVWLHEINV